MSIEQLVLKSGTGDSFQGIEKKDPNDVVKLEESKLTQLLNASQTKELLLHLQRIQDESLQRQQHIPFEGNNLNLRKITEPPSLRIIPPLNFCPVERQLYRSGQPSMINQSFLNQLNLKTIIWLASEEPNDEFLDYCAAQDIQVEFVAGMSEYAYDDEPIQDHITNAKLESNTNADPNTIADANVKATTSTYTSTDTSANTSANINTTTTTSATNAEGDEIAGTGMAEPPIPQRRFHQRLVSLNPWDSLNEQTITKALELVVDKRNYPMLVCCGMGRHRTGTVIGCLRRLQGWNLASVSEEYRRFTGARGGRILVELLIEGFDIRTVKIDPELAPDWLKVRS